jgi:hypothetical protein
MASYPAGPYQEDPYQESAEFLAHEEIVIA